MTPDRATVETARLYLFLLMLAGVVFGLVFSPPFLSVGLIGMVVLGLLDPLVGLNPRWRTGISSALRSPLFWGLAGLYLLLLFSFWQTEDWNYYAERLRIKVPLLMLPLAWPGLVPLGEREKGWVTGGVVVFLAGVVAAVMVNYALNFTEVNDMIRRGQAMPVPRNHIRFSLLVAIATLFSVAAYRHRAFGWRWGWAGLGAFLFLGQHLLAVRSRGTWWPAVVGLIGLTVLPVLAYVAVPSFRTKIQYARYELFHRDKSQDTAEYSDEGRMTSLRIGLQVWRSGLVGGIITLGCFLLLGWYGLRRRLPVYLALWTVFFLSCLVENTLETSAGVSMVCVFLLVLGARAGAMGGTESSAD